MNLRSIGWYDDDVDTFSILLVATEPIPLDFVTVPSAFVEALDVSDKSTVNDVVGDSDFDTVLSVTITSSDSLNVWVVLDDPIDSVIEVDSTSSILSVTMKGVPLELV